jgi:L-fuculose-phosphate aldolase
MMRDEFVDQYRRAGDLGLMELASGNLSCRTPQGMLISPSGFGPATLAPEQVVGMGPDGPQDTSSISSNLKPSSEWQLHAAIYDEYADAQAVIHTHSDACVALASHEQPLPGFHYLVGTFGGNDVPCTAYATFGTPELARLACDAMRERNACLLGHHGMLAYGASLVQAVDRAHQLEILCRQYLLARSLGEPSVLSEQDWEAFFAQVKNLDYGIHH